MSKHYLQMETKRRDPESKLSNKNQDVLLQMLTNELPDLPTKDMDWLKRQEADYKAIVKPLWMKQPLRLQLPLQLPRPVLFVAHRDMFPLSNSTPKLPSRLQRSTKFECC